MNVDEIKGWEKSGGVSNSREVSEIVGKNKETGAMIFIKIAGNKYSIMIGMDNRMGVRTHLSRKSFKDKNKAKLKALEFMNDHEIVGVDTSGPVKIVDENGEKIYPSL